mmetsp:Transcript_13394/g.45869  ORF Transcript_13394/g.45869 Transcript_13394/m.45869 type:complete len:257 (-) Transcript_13394:41-811(-)
MLMTCAVGSRRRRNRGAAEQDHCSDHSMRAGSGASQFKATSDVTNDAPPALGILWTTAAVAPRTRLLPRLPGPGCPRRRWQWTPALLLSHRAVAPLLPASSRARATASSGARRRSVIVRVSPRPRTREGRGARDPDRAMSAKRAEAVDVVAERPSDARPGGRLRDLTPLAFSAPSLSLLQAMHSVLQAMHSEGGGRRGATPETAQSRAQSPGAPQGVGSDDVRCGETGRALSSRRSGFAASSSPSEASPVSGRPSN